MGPVRTGSSGFVVLAGLLVAGPAGGATPPPESCPLASFGPVEKVQTAGVPGLLTGDANRDGLSDLVFFDVAGVNVLPGRGEGGFGPRIVSPIPGVGSALGDLDGDGVADLVLRTTPGLVPAYGDGTGRFTAAGALAAPDDRYFSEVAAGDFDGDGRADLVAVASGQVPATPTLSLFRGAGGRSFEPIRSVPLQGLSLLIESISVGDVDGDGLDDLLVRADKAMIAIYHGTRDGSFRAGFQAFDGYYPAGALLVDLDRDGALDIVATGNPRFGSAELHVFRGDGHGGFRETAVQTLPPNVGAPVVGDFDGEGRLDVAVLPYLFAGDGAGGIGPPATSSVLGTRQAVALDYDRDGRADLAVVPNVGDGIRLYPKVCTVGSASATFVVPFLLSAGGAASAFYESDLSLTNAGDAFGDAELTYTAAIGAGSGQASVSLAAGQQRVVASALDYLDALGIPAPRVGDRGGTLRVRFTGLASPTDAAVGSRTTNRGAGVFLPGIRVADAFRGPAIVGWLREDAGDRTNLALVNAGEAGDGGVTLRVTLTSTDPSSPVSTVTLPDLVLPPGGFRQFDRVLASSGLGAASGTARVERVAGAAPYLAYAVVNDAVTSDGSIVFAVTEASLTAADGLVVPALVEGAGFDTELLLTNLSPSGKRLRLEYVASAVGATGHIATLEVALAPGEHRALAGFVDFLRRSGVPGVGPRGPTFAGALFLSVTEGSPDGLFAGARVTSDAPKGGRYGLFVPAAAPARGAGTAALVSGLREDLGTRSNLALVNLGDGQEADDAFEIDLFDGVTRGRVTTVAGLRVPRKGWLQVDRILAAHAPETAQGYARIRRVSGDSRFLAYGVINEGAVPGNGTGDGSYVPMSIPQEAP